MKKTSIELTVGASIFIALFILIAGVMWLKEMSVAARIVEYTVLFPNVGTLQVGDPVSVGGVRRGEAARIYLSQGMAAVVIKLDRSVRLTDSCRITIQNIGLMGERQIGIQYSDKGSVYAPSSKARETVITGYFDTGIAEAMGMLGRVLQDVQGLLSTVTQIIDSTLGSDDFSLRFNNIVARLDTISTMVSSLISTNRSDLNTTIDNLKAISADVRSLIARNAPHIDTIAANGALLTAGAIGLVERADSIAATLQAMVLSIEKGEGSVGMLLQDEEFFHELKSSVSGLDTLIEDVNANGLKLRIKLGFKRDKKK